MEFFSKSELSFLKIKVFAFYARPLDADTIKKIFTDIWSASDIRFATDTEYSKICFPDTFADILTKYFGSSWFGLLTVPTYDSLLAK